MDDSRYAAAQMISSTIQEHFAQHIANAFANGETGLAPCPSAEAIERMIDTAFWASLRREEGRSPKISLAFLPPELSSAPLLFQERLPLTADVLTKLSPGVERAGIYLGVWLEDNTMYIWGTTMQIPNMCLVLDVSEPGLLVVKHKRLHGFGKFVNVAVFIGDQIKIVDEHNAAVPYCPDMLKFLLGNSTSGSHSVNVTIQLAVSMRAHQRGGLLLIIPAENESWRQSIIQPMKYAVTPYYRGLADLMLQDEYSKNQNLWINNLKKELDNLAGLTAIDGATIIDDKYQLVGFGAKIARAKGSPPVEQIFFHEPVVGGNANIVNPSQSGGTRHLSAAQFINDQRDAIALVASQDGNFTIFTWLPSMNMVQAYRIDTLLL